MQGGRRCKGGRAVQRRRCKGGHARGTAQARRGEEEWARSRLRRTGLEASKPSVEVASCVATLEVCKHLVAGAVPDSSHAGSCGVDKQRACWKHVRCGARPAAGTAVAQQQQLVAREALRGTGGMHSSSCNAQHAQQLIHFFLRGWRPVHLRRQPVGRWRCRWCCRGHGRREARSKPICVAGRLCWRRHCGLLPGWRRRGRRLLPRRCWWRGGLLPRRGRGLQGAVVDRHCSAVVTWRDGCQGGTRCQAPCRRRSCDVAGSRHRRHPQCGGRGLVGSRRRQSPRTGRSLACGHGLGREGRRPCRAALPRDGRRGAAAVAAAAARRRRGLLEAAQRRLPVSNCGHHCSLHGRGAYVERSGRGQQLASLPERQGRREVPTPRVRVGERVAVAVGQKLCLALELPAPAG